MTTFLPRVTSEVIMGWHRAFWAQHRFEASTAHMGATLRHRHPVPAAGSNVMMGKGTIDPKRRRAQCCVYADFRPRPSRGLHQMGELAGADPGEQWAGTARESIRPGNPTRD